MSILILLVFVGIIFGFLWYKEEVQPKRHNSITEMAKRDLKNARRRGDIDKNGRCYHGEWKIL